MNDSPGCLDPGREALLQAALPVRRAAFRRLLSGHAVSIVELAAEVGGSPETVHHAARDVASVGMAEVSDGTIVGMDGLTTRPTEHSLVLDGVHLSTWCAYDIVGIAAALGRDATGSTRCGGCGRAIEVEVRDGEPSGSGVIGWLPSEACSNVRAEFCPSALFFCSADHLDQWLKRSDDREGEALSLADLAERGRDEWRQVVA